MPKPARKTDAQLKGEAANIISRAGVTKYDWDFRECPAELWGQCEAYEYAREALRQRPEVLKTAQAKVQRYSRQHGTKFSPYAYDLRAMGLEKASGLERIAFRCLMEHRNFPQDSFLAEWFARSEAERTEEIERLRPMDKGLVEKFTFQRIPSKILPSIVAEKRVKSGRFTYEHLAINWELVTKRNEKQILKALMALKPLELRQSAGKKSSEFTRLTALGVYRLKQHLTLPQIAALTGNPSHDTHWTQLRNAQRRIAKLIAEAEAQTVIV